MRFPRNEQPPPVRMSRVRFRADAQQDFDQAAESRVRMTSNPNSDAPAHVIRAGSKEALVFALHAPLAGFYLLSFRAEAQPLAPDKAQGEEGAPPRVWTANRYILVREVAGAGAATETA